MANRNIGTLIENTIKRAEEMLATDMKRETEMDYYLNTHNVKDEGYNAIAAYAEENKKKKDSLQHSINLLKSLQQKKGLKIRRKSRYTLVYPVNAKKANRIACRILPEESGKTSRSTIVLQTKGKFMPEDANSLYGFDVFCLIPEKGDTISIAGVFGLTKNSLPSTALQKPNIFRGTTISTERHATPELLAPQGAPIFNRNGYFIGINNKGGMVK